ncbi:Uncharacterized conserved protein, contains FHA domain [Actinomyces bovis]|uniref:Uncharacterized conserved protein, contains FHA domain n=1 Tax=Actinomyces bovis TaxID=1658 RepID=A0ABY1VRT4_9ACTO|nr:FHA domain-containing protein [Actinomyces bovis]SPT54377.1 Uncharacterized conserved protein, contains FHA domain [Actinomyces bovis]VEG56081.1 Uncharacterized conserved protein, contains FHA domain [Actinomyces israelii]
MGLLDGIEKSFGSVGDAAKRTFSHLPSGSVTDVLSQELRRVLAETATPFGHGRSVVANSFIFTVNPQTAERISREGEQAVFASLENTATVFATENGHSFVGPIEFGLALGPEGSQPVLIEASRKRGATAPATAGPTQDRPVIEVDGQRYVLTGEVTILGRGSEADVVVDDSGVSRRHLEIRNRSGHYVATDLGSTNGTLIEGHPIDAATLVDGNTIQVGRTTIRFWDGSQGTSA